MAGNLSSVHDGGGGKGAGRGRGGRGAHADCLRMLISNL